MSSRWHLHLLLVWSYGSSCGGSVLLSSALLDGHPGRDAILQPESTVTSGAVGNNRSLIPLIIYIFSPGNSWRKSQAVLLKIIIIKKNFTYSAAISGDWNHRTTHIHTFHRVPFALISLYPAMHGIQRRTNIAMHQPRAKPQAGNWIFP